jgi:hypothetical protein
MIKLPEKMLRDEAEMRAFYQSVGISPETTELAIRARLSKPAVEETSAPLPKGSAPLPKGKKRKTPVAQK